MYPGSKRYPQFGREALAKQKEEGVRRRLVGFEMTERGIARDDQDVLINSERLGRVTSGSPAPFLKKNIGMAYVPAEFANEGQQIQIDVRGRAVAAAIVKTPFYKRERKFPGPDRPRLLRSVNNGQGN